MSVPDDGRDDGRGSAADEDEDLYDLYLDAALAGGADAPDVFLARHPAAGAALRGRIEALHRIVVAPAAGAAAPRARTAAEAEEGLPFERLGEFRLLRKLGEGGMGAVYLAEQESLGRVVALKAIRADLRGSPTAAARFRREAHLVAKLRHPHIVAVFAVGEETGVLFLAMEYVPGRGLDEELKDAASSGSRVPVSDAVRWAAEIADALTCAHAEGIIHRDVKPSNVRITPEGRALLLDFGVAHEIGEDRLTVAGSFVGSPLYAAPEQLRGAEGAIDARTDVFGLGALLYECVAGRAPVAPGTMEQILHRVLIDEPAPPRRLRPGIPRDLEVVVLKALEKDPARRYQSAAAMADDLRAIIEFRPISARPPGPAGRAWRWARRHPGPAAAIASISLAAVVVGALAVVRDREGSERTRSDARAAIAEAHTRLDEYRRDRESGYALDRELADLTNYIMSSHLSAEQSRRFDELETAAAHRRREREAIFYGVMDLVRRAERLDPDVPGTDAVRAELYAEKWREADASGDADATSFYRDRVLESDTSGGLTAEVRGSAVLSLTTDPPGADAYLFRYCEQSELFAGGERRLVPVPVGAESPVRPGTHALVVVAGAVGVERGDLVIEIDGKPVGSRDPAEERADAERGGARARVHHMGGVSEMTLPPGLRVRSTAAPLALSEACLKGPTPIDGVAVESGTYVVLLRAPGREDQRVWFNTRTAKEQARAAELLPEGTTPAGFVRVVCNGNGAVAPFWIMEREVVVEEYLAYLNDAETLAEIAASPRPIRFPRSAQTAPSGGHWKRDESGRFVVPPEWKDWPVLGVSYDDAEAYARWRTRRDPAGRVFEIPRLPEVEAAGRGPGARDFVFGNVFRPKWMKSCFAKKQAGPEPVFSYPVDESPAGAFDMSGSVYEWCDSWFDEGRGLKRLTGGAWGQAKPEIFRMYGGCGYPHDVATDECGIRLVIRGATMAAR